MIFPKIKSGFILLAAVIPAAISGREVPIAITVKPITASEIPRILDIWIELSTVISAPKMVRNIESSNIGIPNILGYSKVFFEIKSSFISIFSVSEIF